MRKVSENKVVTIKCGDFDKYGRLLIDIKERGALTDETISEWLVKNKNGKIEGYDTSKLVNSKGECKTTNRNMFPIDCPYLRDDDLFRVNKLITDWREETKDFFLTSFKSCKKDGIYRKRVSFKEIRWVLEKYYSSKTMGVTTKVTL